MKYELGTPAYSSNDRSPDELAKLIRKLRWIGLEDEARRLERTADMRPPEKVAARRPERAAPVNG